MPVAPDKASPQTATKSEPLSKPSASIGLDLLDGDVPSGVKPPMFGDASILVPTAAADADVAAPAAGDVAATPPPSSAPAGPPLTRSDSTMSATAKDGNKSKDKAAGKPAPTKDAPKEKLGLFGTIMGRKKKEKTYARPVARRQRPRCSA